MQRKHLSIILLNKRRDDVLQAVGEMVEFWDENGAILSDEELAVRRAYLEYERVNQERQEFAKEATHAG